MIRDGASVSRSKSLENAGLLGGTDKRLLAAKGEHRNSSCGNLDHLISTGKESRNQLGEESKRKLNETAGESNCFANKSKQRIGNRSEAGEYNSFRLKAFIRKKQGLRSSIRRKSSSATQSNELRTVHLQVIERELRSKSKDDRLQADARHDGTAHGDASQTLDDRRRRQSTGEILKYSQANRAGENRATIANQSELTKSLNENLFKGHRALTGE